MSVQGTYHNEQDPAAVVYCYRTMDSAQTHALSIELWYQGKRLAYVEPIHCTELNLTQINLWLEQAVRALSLTYGVKLGRSVYSFTLDPAECPLRPCSALPSDHLDKIGNLSKRETRQGAWSNIWVYQQFYASFFATYTGIRDSDAIELLTQLEEAGCVQLGQQIGDVLPARSHAFAFNPKHKTYEIDFKRVSRNINQVDTGSRKTDSFTAYRQVWMVARIFQTFKLEDILVGAEVSSSIASWYLEQLYQIGYLQRVESSQTDLDDEISTHTYRLIRNSGPIAPLVCNSGVTCDINRSPTLYKPDGYC